MTSKETFILQKDLRDPLLAIVHESWFERCLIYATAAMTEGSGSTAEELRGANKFKEILLNLAEEEEAPTAFAVTGLNHDIDDPKKPADKKKE